MSADNPSIVPGVARPTLARQRMKELTRTEIRFIAEYFKIEPRNATEAAWRVYDCADRDSAGDVGAEVMNRPHVKQEMERWERQMMRGNVVTLEEFNAEVMRLAFADSRELTQYRIGACRYCFGIRFEYQRTEAEYRRDLKKYLADNELMFGPIGLKAGSDKYDPLGLKFDVQGGTGFDPHAEPHPDCCECWGEGVGYIWTADSRRLSPVGARLFEVVKQTKDGIEIKIRSRDKHLDMLGRVIGALDGKKNDPDEPDDGTVRIKGGLPELPRRALPPADSGALPPDSEPRSMPLAGSSDGAGGDGPAPTSDNSGATPQQPAASDSAATPEQDGANGGVPS